jgi:hypothetical protein
MALLIEKMSDLFRATIDYLLPLNLMHFVGAILTII